MPRKPELPGVDALFVRPQPESDREEEQQPDRPQGHAGPEPRPVKFTFYFSPDTLEALEQAWFELRRRTGRRISKSEIVDRVVRQGLEDLARLEELLAG